MATNEQEPVDRIQTAMHGTPKLHPDEQRKYLGTFRERVEVAVTVYQLKRAHYVDELKRAFAEHPEDKLYINGNLDQDFIGPYIKAASQAGIQFTIKTDDIYRTDDENYALVLTADHAVNRDVIDIQKRYQTQAAPKQDAPHGLLNKLKHLF
ncbi:YueI family protein [Lactiplantibacillus plajomi]|uniref:YueI family protein n=1 Tax=Lactiplantibacillus plajomi TaxID=1457217 RepID=A0ABV6K6I9_9LACO|nr:YueI family protein [Lactiplantibacillus plajomi]